jgi:hypothetical protein
MEQEGAMSITDELRKVAAKTECANGRCEKLYRGDLERIADRIDAEHEKQMAERRRSCVFYDAERNYCKVHDEGDMAELGYVRLPVDADGVPIRIGDVMEGVDKYDSLKKVKGEVITVSFESDGIVDVAIQAWNSDGKSWHRAYLDSGASVYRHYHAPTVEDVLEEFVARWLDTHHDDLPSLKAEYAAKLQLKEDE